MDAEAPLLRLSNLTRTFAQSGGLMGKTVTFRAVDDVNLSLYPRKTLGLVGESGSGKSTVAKMAVRLLPPSQGNIYLEDRPIYPEAGKKPDTTFLRSLPSRLQMVFQDPYSSLNPRLKIGYSIAEPLICSGVPRHEARERVNELLDNVGLSPKDSARYPHEFSGGQRQRIALARALAPRPQIIVCDEPVSSLDASVQAQVLNLLKDSQDALGLTYLFISHDLTVVSHMSDQVAVMYLGRIVELGDTDQLFTQPLHPYTKILLEASTGNRKKARGGRTGDHADSTCAGRQDKGSFHAAQDAENPVTDQNDSAALGSALPAGAWAGGCAFAPRCPKAQADCVERDPQLEFCTTHQVRCFYPG